ncbi:cAMP-binding domain of CRP or a regulatory subunit of cAMP-dependent protein kinase [Dehalogenimonas formicexedens]|uniref:cAMP-binding domain of CRP or a regulatory subunit of cAMP-dependent protein kinase n=3 Tax=Dehalococcoidaceae TaxID=1202464 RepID=A0A1P8FA29_9CHLR|nr:cAMP-binding domain of CRP or a regulatory subunit of cAMP-dependent protein kinase [Dehalogenimonas formicexedens]KTB49120.1 transcriptional regulator, Crp/Fnr family [Dehalogenimonas alkenigignens]
MIGCMSDFWLFESLNASEKEYVRTLFRRPMYGKGEYLFMQGEPSTAVFMVFEGKIKLFKTSDEGKEIVLGYLTSHDLFGEEVLFNDSVHALSAQAMERSRLCACYKTDFESLIAQNSSIAIKTIRILSERLGTMNERLADMAICDTQTRLARMLGRLAQEHGEVTKDGRRLAFRMTHDELGALTGTSRVMVTNVLKNLKKAGIVKDDLEHKFIISNWFLKEMELHPRNEVEELVPNLNCQCLSQS